MQTGKYIYTSYFEWQGHNIVAQGSMFSGKEWIYVDDQLVSEKWSWKYHSGHRFTLDGQVLNVRFIVHSLMKGPIDIKLLQGEHCLDQDTINLHKIATQQLGGKSLKRGLVEAFARGLVFGVIAVLIIESLTTWLKG